MYYPNLFDARLSKESKGFLPYSKLTTTSIYEGKSRGFSPSYACLDDAYGLELQVNPFHVVGCLAKYFDDYRLFCKLLIDTRSVIAGSTVLAMMAHDTFANSDMDIYVDEGTSNFQTLNDFILSQGYKVEFAGKLHSYTTNVMKFVHESKPDCNIDLVTCRADYTDKNPIEAKVLSSDMTCCMNVFNGRDIYSYYPLQTLSMKSMLHKRIYKDGRFTRIKNLSDDDPIERIARYNSRGYELITQTIVSGVITAPPFVTVSDYKGTCAIMEIRIPVRPYHEELIEASMSPGCATPHKHGKNCDCVGMFRCGAYRDGGSLYKECKLNFESMKFD